MVQEEKLTKGLGVRGRMDGPDLLTNPPDFGWTPGSKHISSTHMVPICNGAKVERSFLSHSGDASISSASSQDSFSGSNRKSGSAVTKRKKSSSDMDMDNDQMFLGASDTLARPCMDTKNINHSRLVQAGCMSSKKVPGLSMITLEGPLPTRGSASQEGRDFQNGKTVMPKPELISLHMGRLDVLPPKQSTVSNCDECTCQQSLPTPRPSLSCEEKQESMGIQTSVHDLLKDFKRDLDSPNAVSKQYDLSEKIISLDESKIGDAHSPQFVRNRQDKGSLKKPNPISLGKDIVSLAASHVKVISHLCINYAPNTRFSCLKCGLMFASQIDVKPVNYHLVYQISDSSPFLLLLKIAPKLPVLGICSLFQVSEDCNGDDVSGNRGNHLNAEKGASRNEQVLFQNGFCADKEQAKQDFKPVSTNIRTTRMDMKDSQIQGCSASQKVKIKIRLPHQFDI